MTMDDIAPEWGPRVTTDWSVAAWLQHPRDSVCHTAPAHIVLVQLSAVNERWTAIASDRFRHYHPTRGAVEFIPSDVEHRAAWEQTKSSAFFGLKADALEEIAEREIGRTAVELVAPPLGTVDKYILQLSELMRQHVANGSFLAQIHADAISTLLAIHILENYASRPARRSPAKGGGLRPAARRAILELMEARVSSGVTTTELAAISGLSVSHFMRAFKHDFGRSPHRYLLDLRMDVAVAAVRSTSLPLAQIAADSGFSSQSHMTAAFARFRNITPGEIRRGC